MSNVALVHSPQESAVVWSEQQVNILKQTYAKGLTDPEFGLYTQVCQRTGLDPFRKQIYAIKRPGKWNPKTQQMGEGALTFQTGIDGYRAIAHRSGEYDGQDDVEWCGKDGKWVTVWLADEPPAAARVRVYRRGKPYSAVARYSAYVQTKAVYENKQVVGQVPNDMWTKMPDNQLAKCAESLALRKAFPEELSGVYTREEMGQAENESGPSVAKTQVPPHDPATGEIVEEPTGPSVEQIALEYSTMRSGVTTYAAAKKLYGQAMRDKRLPKGEQRDLLLQAIEKLGVKLKDEEQAGKPVLMAHSLAADDADLYGLGNV